MDGRNTARSNRRLPSTATIAGRLAFAAILGCSAIVDAAAQDQATAEAADRKFLELGALSVGLHVTNTPDPVAAQRDGPSGLPYTWLYKTTVESPGGPITIEDSAISPSRRDSGTLPR
jgi:hypothetical protein